MRLAQLPWLLLALTAEKRSVQGFDVRVAGTMDEADAVALHLVDALSLIELYDPATAVDAHSRVKWLLFTETSGASYLAAIRSIRIGIGYAHRVTALELAMTVIHELTHAQFFDRGIKYRGADRQRIERACVAAEIAFARRVPNSETAIAKVEALLTTEWWNAEKTGPESVRELAERGVPPWLGRLIVKRSSRTARGS